MCHENMLLQTEANNLRARLKAMQETIDALTKKNSQLLAEKAIAAWSDAGDGNSDVGEMVAQYLKEIQELQAKLLESEALCQQLRKNSSRQQAIVLSPTSKSGDVILLKLEKDILTVFILGTSKPDPSLKSYVVRRSKSFSEITLETNYSSAWSSSSNSGND